LYARRLQIVKEVNITTLMTYGNSSGERKSCNALCHNATHPKCVCICSGRYHGSAHQPGGVEQAVKDTWEEAIQEAEEKARAEGMELDTSRLREFIGLEPAEHAIQVGNHDNHGNGANHQTRRGWGTIKRANLATGAQGTLMLEVGRPFQ